MKWVNAKISDLVAKLQCSACLAIASSRRAGAASAEIDLPTPELQWSVTSVQERRWVHRLQRRHKRTGAPFINKFQVQKDPKYSIAVMANMMLYP